MHLTIRLKTVKDVNGNGDVTVIVDAPDATYNQDKSSGCTPLL